MDEPVDPQNRTQTGTGQKPDHKTGLPKIQKLRKFWKIIYIYSCESKPLFINLKKMLLLCAILSIFFVSNFQYRQSWTSKYKQDLYPGYYTVTNFILQNTTWSLTWRQDQKHKDSIWFLWHSVNSKSSLHNVAFVLYRTTILLDAWFLFRPCLRIV